MCCGGSSGGTPLRHVGRIGPVACYGSGIYCKEYNIPDNKSNFISTCTSGTGEHIMQTLLASNICNFYNETSDVKILLYIKYV